MNPTDEPRGARADASTSQAGDAALDGLLTRVADGDADAFATLYDAVAPRVFGLARRILRNHALAEEVTQDVLVEVWRTAPRFDAHRGSAIGWMLMLAHRRSVDRVRRSSSRQDRETRDAARQPVQEPIDAALERSEDAREVRTALADLTYLQREAVELAYYGGHTYREVAERLAVPEGTAKSRLRDGLRQLRASLGGAA